MGQAVLEQRHLVSDLLPVSTFDHVCPTQAPNAEAKTVKQALTQRDRKAIGERERWRN